MNKTYRLLIIGIFSFLAISLGSLIVFKNAAALSTFIYVQGGTGTTTPNIGQLAWWGSSHLDGVATTSATCAGTVSCTSFTVIGASPITITGAAGGGSDPFYHPAANQSATTSTMLFFGSASTTQLTATSSVWLTGVTASRLLALDNNNLVIATSTIGWNLIKGTASSIFAFDASGNPIATTSIGVNYLTGVLPIANGGTNASSFGTSNGIVAYNGTSLVNYTNYTLTSLLLSATNASTTALTVGSFLTIPNASSPSLNQTGQLSVNTSAASSSIQFYDGTAQRGLYETTSFTFNFASTTPTGTTTKIIQLGPRGNTFTSMACASVGPTANVQIGTGAASSTMVTTTAVPVTPTTLSSNNAFQAWQTMYVAIGTFSAATPIQISCGFGRRYAY